MDRDGNLGGMVEVSMVNPNHPCSDVVYLYDLYFLEGVTQDKIEPCRMFGLCWRLRIAEILSGLGIALKLEQPSFITRRG
jgi:hypothetical protein